MGNNRDILGAQRIHNLVMIHNILWGEIGLCWKCSGYINRILIELSYDKIEILRGVRR